MKEIESTCQCLDKLMAIGMVERYFKPTDSYFPSIKERDVEIFGEYVSEDIEEGQMCLVYRDIEDDGYYLDYTWISNIKIFKELHPIEFCPICGKKIEYKKSMSLTKKN